MNKALFGFLILFVAGCSTLENSCHDLASRAEWKKVEPQDTVENLILNKLIPPDTEVAIWLMSGNGNLGICTSCGNKEHNKAAYFVIFDSGSINSKEMEVTARNCGKY